MPWTAAEPGKAIQLKRLPGGAIAGTVLAQDGRPSSGQVYLQPADEETRGRFSGWTNAQAHADETGAFQFLGLPPGTYELSADVQASSSTWQARITASVTAGATTSAALRATAGLQLSGKVTDEKGRGVAGAMVFARSQTVVDLTEFYECGTVAGGRARATADDRGEFHLEGLTDEPWRLSARYDDLGDAPEQVVTPPASGVVLTIPAPALLTGHVRDHEGRPLPTFTVAERPVTSADGSFSISLPLLDAREVTFAAPGHLAREVVVDASPGLTLALEVVLPVARPLTGKVSDSAGLPIGDTLVTWTSADGAFSTSAFTGGDGAFRLERAGAGTVSLFALEGTEVETPVPADAPTLAIVVPRLGSLRGIVLDRRGHPVRGAGLELAPHLLAQSGTGPRTALTNEAGEYTFGRVRPGSYEVRLTPSGQEPPRPVLVESGRESRQDFRLATETIRVAVELASSRSEVQAFIRPGRHVQPSNWAELASFVRESYGSAMDEPSRTWEFEVPPGSYTLLLFAKAPQERYHRRPRAMRVFTTEFEASSGARLAVDFPDDAPTVLRPDADQR